MLPTLLKLGPITLHSYGLMIALGFLLAVYLTRRDAAKVGIDPDIMSDTAFWLLLLGIIGSRIFHIIWYPAGYSWSNPLGWIAIWEGGLVFLGALPPCIAYCVYVVRRNKIRAWVFADVVAPYIPLGHAFGRVGCFLNGCCYGEQCDLPWAVSFPRVPHDLSEAAVGSPPYLHHVHEGLIPPDAQWSLPIHPTQLYSVIGLLAIFTIIIVLRKRWRPFTGFTFTFYLMLYGAMRFGVEFLRGDGNPGHLPGLSDMQLIALGMVLTGVVMTYILRRLDLPHGKPQPF